MNDHKITQNYFRGTINSYSNKAGYGYIKSDDNQFLEDLILVHSKSLRDPKKSIHKGDRVIFTTRQVPTGVLATDVHLEIIEELKVGHNEENVEGKISDYDPKSECGGILLHDKRKVFFHKSFFCDNSHSITVDMIVTCRIVNTSVGLQAQDIKIDTGRVMLARPSSDWLAEAIIARDGRKYEEAAALYEKGLNESPTIQLILSYAAMQKNRGRKESAKRIYEKGISVFPDNVKLREDAGILLASFGEFHDAISMLKEGLAICRRTQKSGEKGLLIALARTHYQLSTLTSLRDALKYYNEAITAFGRGRTHLPEEDLLKMNMAKIRTQHHRGNLTVQFLNSAQFTIVKANLLYRVTEGADLVVEIENPEFRESYGIGRYLLIRCVFKSDVQLSDLVDLDESILKWANLGLADEQLALLVVASLPLELQRLLAQRIEDRRRLSPAIVPIPQSDIETASTGQDALRAALDRWLYRRDLFAVNSPVEGRRFFGRDKPLSELRDTIAAGIPAGIFGLRKVGKTSLLKETQRRASEIGDAVVYFDLSRVPSDISDCRWIYWKLATQIREQVSNLPLHSFKWRLGGEYVDYLDIPNSFPIATAFDSELTRLLQTIKNSPISPKPKIVILLDEIERLLPTNLGKEGFDGFFDFFSYLRGLSQENNNFLLIITGANAQICEAAQFNGRDNPVFNYFKEIYLQLLEFSECALMIRELSRGMGVRFEQSAIDRVYSLTGGHPFFTRQFCSFLSQQNTDRPLDIQKHMVDNLVSQYLELRSDDFREIMQRLERDFPDELAVCIKLVKAGGSLSHEALKAEIPSYSIPSIKHLIGYQIVRLDRSRVVLTIEMLTRWLRNKYAI